MRLASRKSRTSDFLYSLQPPGTSAKTFGINHSVKKKFAIITTTVAAFLAVVVLASYPSRPPAKWQNVTSGMTRSNVYSLLGKPTETNENTKGGVRWRSNGAAGRWEFDVYFREDDTVGAFGKRWRWHW